MNKVVGLLKANPGIRIEISGYTDNTGNGITTKYYLRIGQKQWLII